MHEKQAHTHPTRNFHHATHGSHIFVCPDTLKVAAAVLPVVVDKLTRQGVNDALVLDSPSSDAYDVCNPNGFHSLDLLCQHYCLAELDVIASAFVPLCCVQPEQSARAMLTQGTQCAALPQ